jgi:DivIVA domain-containing protein
VTLILLYLAVLVVVAALLFVIASALFGRGEPLPPLPRATTATVLPVSGVTGADVDAVKFTQTLRGYKTSEVDWVLDRLGSEIELLRGQLSALRALGEDEPTVEHSARGAAPRIERSLSEDEPVRESE